MGTEKFNLYLSNALEVLTWKVQCITIIKQLQFLSAFVIYQSEHQPK